VTNRVYYAFMRRAIGRQLDPDLASDARTAQWRVIAGPSLPYLF
jgi:hypothetical protein